MTQQKMPTGKSLGLAVGDFVSGGHFVGIIMSDERTFAPCVESWACTMSHEMGSAYATDLKKITYAEFLSAAMRYGYDGPDSKKGKEAVRLASTTSAPVSTPKQ